MIVSLARPPMRFVLWRVLNPCSRVYLLLWVRPTTRVPAGPVEAALGEPELSGPVGAVVALCAMQAIPEFADERELTPPLVVDPKNTGNFDVGVFRQPPLAAFLCRFHGASSRLNGYFFGA